MRIADVLPQPLRGLFDQQLAQVSAYLEKGDDKQVAAMAQEAMRQTLQQMFGLPEQEAVSVSILACRGGSASRIELAERLALQRALAASGSAASVRPYLLAAAQGACAGLAISDEAFVVSAAPFVPAHVELHSLDDIGAADGLFSAEGWE
jgi:hypothetical protein